MLPEKFIAQTGISPEFRATWVLRREKKGPFPAIFCLFPAFGPKKCRKKTCTQPWYARKSGCSLAPIAITDQERKWHIKLRKSSGPRPGVFGTPGGTNRELPVGIPGSSCCFFRKSDRKRAFLPGHRPGVPGTPSQCL